ncbi:hypothetical protein Q5H93_18760 [Hymenobacter sp. ASUV-10]|uniref:Uncharacterized protein n=1 Tax=Hymenobacter aranciens TaxID=3063996 RepID=A0ABT9BET7_9BACT|nr:hypothetical protein [Hymenobacter sp. ASUV-10]MDO7876794.1 hypothetical protein [Hymenobacter sp. ASUV-10]
MDYSSLKTREECDLAKAEVEFERRTYANRDEDADIADVRAGRTQASTTSQLAKVEARIASANAVLAAPGIDAELQETTTDELAALQVQRTRLVKRQRQSSGLARFLAAVDAEQVAAQVATLTTIIAGIDAHRATLPA